MSLKNCKNAKFYSSEIKLIYSTWGGPGTPQYVRRFAGKMYYTMYYIR